jgi:retron-type reverse transcriptase
MNDEIFRQIVSLDNLRAAYLELADRFTAKLQDRRYQGLDGFKLEDLDYNATANLKIIQTELLSGQRLVPATCHYIPKRSGELREIYIYSLRDRIKAQAIARVLAPILEKVYSPFLFSYRSSHPSHWAARSAVRRYRRYRGKDFVLLMDLKQYSENIDREILLNQLAELNLSQSVLDLVRLFVYQRVVREGEVIELSRGLVQGVPLVALFANLYLNKIDHWVGREVSFYRRVGDDLIVCDQSETKVMEVYNYLQSALADLKLEIQTNKVKLIRSSEPFEFLGYRLAAGRVSISPSGEKKIINHWRRVLHYYPVAESLKTARLKTRLWEGRSRYLIILKILLVNIVTLMIAIRQNIYRSSLCTV